MNYLIQRGKVRSQMIAIPDGFPELLSDITREVLRCQPTSECLCQFIIDYLHSLIVTREKAAFAQQIIERALRAVDEIISSMCICDIPKTKADEMALVMEDCFKRFLEKRRCEKEKGHEILKFNEMDLLSEMINRCKFTEMELRIARPAIEDAYHRFVDTYLKSTKATESAEALYRYFKGREAKRAEEEQINKAATRIQASFRGFLVRQARLIHRGPPAEPKEELPKIPSGDWEELDMAARRIQSFFRKMRKTSVQPLVYVMDDVTPAGFPEEICSLKSILSMDTALNVTQKKETLQGKPAIITPDDTQPEEAIAESAQLESEPVAKEAVRESVADQELPAPEPVEEPPEPQPVSNVQSPAPEPETAPVEEPQAPTTAEEPLAQPVPEEEPTETAAPAETEEPAPAEEPPAAE